MTETTAAARSVAQVPTALAERYLAQLCKHFAHRLPVEHDGPAGRITFPETGICRLEAKDGVLTLHAESPDAEALARLQDVVARHLARFAFRAPPEVVWTPEAA